MEFKDVFEGIGCIKEEQEIIVNPEVTPKIQATRKVPLALLEDLKLELNNLERNSIIVKVQEPTEWVNAMVIVKKPNGGIRICLDPLYLNNAIKREHCHLPTVDEITSKLAGAKIFTTLDANKGYFQIKLTEKSTNLTCFSTPFSRYKYLRLPFGIKSASEIFHKHFAQVFEGLEGILTYADDIIIWGKDREEHDGRLRAALQRIREKNVKLNKQKCKIGETKIQFLGYILSEEGMQIDMNKIRPLLEMPIPQDKKAVERFLGMITYVAKFIPNLAQKTATLRDLLKQDNIFTWQQPQDEAFQALKKILTTQPVLQYFDSTKPITLSVDASKEGVGAVLLQNGLPIMYASKSLTESQKNWAQIEKETYAILFGCERMHQFIYGSKNPIQIETDHKPLETIFKKPLADCPLRLQRMRIRLQAYDFNLRYVKGKELYIADTLSRAYIDDSNDKDNSTERQIEAHIALIQYNVKMSDRRNEEIKQETQRDETLQILSTTIKDGWPESKNEVIDSLKPYWTYREELIIMNDLIYKGKQVIIPKTLRKDILGRIHYNHQGIEKCKQRARQSVYWPNMNQHIEDFIGNCETCRKFRKSQGKETLLPHVIPPRPWHTLALDIFQIRNTQYLLCVDYYSKYVEITKLDSIKCDNIIKALKRIFATHGIPVKTMSDNGTQFSSYTFRCFAREWNFRTCTSSPHYPQSNGMAERHIGTIKRMMKKAIHDKLDMELCLLEYRNTPIGDSLGSPAQLLMGRNIRGILPQVEEQLQIYTPKVNIEDTLRRRQQTQEFYYNKGTKDLDRLHPNDRIYAHDKDNKRWSPAIVIKECDRPRSYQIKTETGQTLERNRKVLTKVRNKPTMDKPSTTKKEAIEKEQESTEHTTRKEEIVGNKEVITKYGRISKRPSRYIEEY